MNPFEFTKALTDLWTNQAQTMLKAMTDGTVPAVSGVPDVATGGAEMKRASQALIEMWSGASTLSSQLASKLPTAEAGDGTLQAVLGKIMDPRQWLAGDGDEMMGRMAEGPLLADLGQIERRYAAVLQATIELRRRSLEQNAVMLQAWMRAGHAFAAELAGPIGEKATALDTKAALALWTETANKELLATQRSEAFLAAQRELIRANTALRLAQRDLVEYLGNQYGIPTRTELDDVHRSVTELRRELRAMQRQQRRSQKGAE